ncbi:MAG: hypothetical protein KF752_18590 [Pirellulaceae bacterium]|nr:hypothetical protein [Pirellulaceae bacterium]
MQGQLPWETEIDTPATIAVIGGGPCGIEAALYARFLGYSVDVYDADKIGNSLAYWGNRRLPGCWRNWVTSLGLAALEAHEHPLPDLQAVPTCHEYVQQYLLPLARTDLLYSSINNRTPVLSISRLGCSNSAELAICQRADQEFRILLHSGERGDFSQIVDIVLDCSGSQFVRKQLASGGGQPAGWQAVVGQVLLGKRPILGKERSLFSGQRIMLFGSDDTAMANALEIAQLAQSESSPETTLFWVVPKRLVQPERVLELPADSGFVDGDEVERAEQLYRQADSRRIVPLTAWGVEAIAPSQRGWKVTLQTGPDETLELEVDRLVHCGDRLPAAGYHHSLQLEPWSDGGACDAAVTREPHFYLLGDRGQQPVGGVNGSSVYRPCPISRIHEQIRRVFGMIGGRADLDLYSSVRPRSIEG